MNCSHFDRHSLVNGRTQGRACVSLDRGIGDGGTGEDVGKLVEELRCLLELHFHQVVFGFRDAPDAALNYLEHL